MGRHKKHITHYTNERESTEGDGKTQDNIGRDIQTQIRARDRNEREAEGVP